ncbi:helix-turn-helix transcriptional regulator [Methylocapsa acidiphila]|uniref:helix-turn-helix transcriptional regulator n=1 Tax=Methylocapsa acidiphila TaxID=133552 RepID=UPI000415C8F3|nr:AraC family transcriptional regulator [Methylocapsa acidiphila]
MYERAAAAPSAPVSLVHMDEGRALWLGARGYLASHNGGAPVYLVGLYGKFRLRMRGGDWRLCRAAVIPPGLWHELDFFGEPFAALYLEPNVGGAESLFPFLREKDAADGVAFGAPDEVDLMRSLYERPDGERAAGLQLDDLLAFSNKIADAAPIDPRLRAVVDFLQAHCEDLTPVADLAGRVGLSGSRFQHLFTAQIGAPFRRYRAWNRLRSACRALARGQSVTMAALEAGFFDSAHLAHEFRKTFGSTPSAQGKQATHLGAIR